MLSGALVARLAWFAAAAVVLCSCTGDASAPPAAGRIATAELRPDRSEWRNLAPSGWGPTEGELAHAADVVAAMSDRALVGQLFVADYARTAAPVGLVKRFRLGGVIVGSANVSDPSQLAGVIARTQQARHAPWPLVVTVDQEGGAVARIGAPMTQFPTFMSVGAAGRPRLARQVALASGAELRALGFTMVFAPDADVTIGPADPTIRSRSLGSRPGPVSKLVTASLTGYLRSGIVPVLKHFPGHGSVTTNSHHTLPHQKAPVRRLAARDLRPFAAGVAAHAPAVMVGHIALDRLDPGTPADLSGPSLDLLTSRLGFAGLITTDALNMAAVTRRYDPERAAVLALAAGADLLVMPANLPRAFRGVLGALRDGRLDRDELEASAAKIGALMLHEASTPRPAKQVVGSHRALSSQLSRAALTLVSGACRGPYVRGAVRPLGEPWAVAAFERRAPGRVAARARRRAGGHAHGPAAPAPRRRGRLPRDPLCTGQDRAGPDQGRHPAGAVWVDARGDGRARQRARRRCAPPRPAAGADTRSSSGSLRCYAGLAANHLPYAPIVVRAVVG